MGDAVDNATNNLLYFVPFVVLFDSVVAVYSYAYHVVIANASIKAQHQFRSTLKAPSKWLFSGQEGNTLLDVLLLFRSGCKTQEEFFQKNSLGNIQFQRIFCTVFTGLLSIIFSMGIFDVAANARHLAIPYVIFAVTQSYTLIESWRFGHKLIELSRAASLTSHLQDN